MTLDENFDKNIFCYIGAVILKFFDLYDKSNE